MVIRDGARVRLFSRNGNDWSGRYPWIVEAALKNNHDQFVIDGEASCWGSTGSRSSMPYTGASTITKSSSTPSTSSRSMARIAAYTVTFSSSGKPARPRSLGCCTREGHMIASGVIHVLFKSGARSAFPPPTDETKILYTTVGTYAGTSLRIDAFANGITSSP
jgi:hypothetical protein